MRRKCTRVGAECQLERDSTGNESAARCAAVSDRLQTRSNDLPTGVKDVSPCLILVIERS
jgi:hypothetical protein